MTTRGIPPVSDYAHWNEDAEAVWFAENAYDMEHGFGEATMFDNFDWFADDDNEG
jgi:hypothetical protein